MAITKAQVNARVMELRKQAEKLQADLNATLGAIQDCGFWLNQIEMEEQNAGNLPKAS